MPNHRTPHSISISNRSLAAFAQFRLEAPVCGATVVVVDAAYLNRPLFRFCAHVHRHTTGLIWYIGFHEFLVVDNTRSLGAYPEN